MHGFSFGLGFRATSGPQVPDTLYLAMGGDSLALRSVSSAGTPDNLAAFISECEAFYGSSNVTIEGFAQGGLQLPETWATIKSNTVYFWEDTTSQPSTKLTGLISAGITTPSAVNAVILFLGTNDIGTSLQTAYDAATITKAQYKTAYKELAAYLKQTAFPAARFIGIVPYHRNDGSVTSTTLSQAIKEATLEAIDEVTYMKLMPCIWDVDLADSVHPTGEEQVDPATAAYQAVILPRMAEAVATYHGKTSGSTVGPKMTTAELKSDHILVTVTHDKGTDITVPSNSKVGFRVDDDGSALTINDITRQSATTFKVDLPNQNLNAASVYKLYASYGQTAGLAATSAEVIVDNSTNTLSLVQGLITVTEADPIRQLTNLVADMNARSGTKTLSGSDVTVITDSTGNTFTSAAGRYPQYDDTAFSGAGALFGPDTTTHMRHGSNFTASSTGFGGCVFLVPASPDGDAEFLFFGSNTTGSQRCGLRYAVTGDKLQWRNNEADGIQDIKTGGVAGTPHIVLWNFNSNSSLDLYINSLTPINIDPYDALGSQVRMWMFTRTTTQTGCTNLQIARAFHKNSAHDSGSDPPISEIVTYLADKYSVSFDEGGGGSFASGDFNSSDFDTGA